MPGGRGVTEVTGLSPSLESEQGGIMRKKAKGGSPMSPRQDGLMCPSSQSGWEAT